MGEISKSSNTGQDNAGLPPEFERGMRVNRINYWVIGVIGGLGGSGGVRVGEEC